MKKVLSVLIGFILPISLFIFYLTPKYETEWATWKAGDEVAMIAGCTDLAVLKDVAITGATNYPKAVEKFREALDKGVCIAVPPMMAPVGKLVKVVYKPVLISDRATYKGAIWEVVFEDGFKAYAVLPDDSGPHDIKKSI